MSFVCELNDSDIVVTRLHQLQFNLMIPQNIVGIGHSGIVGKAIPGDDHLGGGVFRHLLYVLGLDILSQTDQQQVVVPHGIGGFVVDINRMDGVGERHAQFEHDLIHL